MKKIIIILFLLINFNTFAQNKTIDWGYIALETSYVTLNIIDYKLSVDAINNGAKELNFFVKNMNPLEMGLVKIGLVSTVILSTRFLIYPKNPWGARILLISGNLIYSAVVYHNYQITLSLKI